MTRKARMLVAALAAGEELEAAAARIGYGIAYAKKLAREPTIIQAVEARRELLARHAEAAADGPPAPPVPEAILDTLMADDTLSPTEMVAVLRAKLAYLAHRAGEPREEAPITLVDDIPEMDERQCELCEYKRRVLDGHDGAGCGEDDRTADT